MNPGASIAIVDLKHGIAGHVMLCAHIRVFVAVHVYKHKLEPEMMALVSHVFVSDSS